MAEKVLLYGIDGGTFVYLKPLMDKGLLPNLKAMAERGASGELWSSLPPVTAVAWSNIATGKTPAKHRITDFLIRKPGSYEEAPSNAMDRQGAHFWDIMAREGKTSLVLNVPMTYPPKVEKGVMIADGFLSPVKRRDYVYPKEVLEEIESKFGEYYILPKYLLQDPWRSDETMQRYMEDLSAMLEYKLKVAEYLIETRDPDFVMHHVWGTDIMSHKLWRLMDTNHHAHDPALAERYRPLIEDYHVAVDAGLARLKDAMGEGTTAVVISDHGFGEIKRSVDLNAWLAKEGYMHFKQGGGTKFRLALWRNGFTFSRLLDFLLKAFVALSRHIKFVTPPPERALAAAWRKRAPLFLSLNDVDWSKTKAYSKIGIGQIVFNVKGREPEGIVEPGEEFERLTDEIAGKLKTLRDPETGDVVFDRVHVKRDSPSGPFVDEVADVVVTPSTTGYVARTPSNIIFDNRVISPTQLLEGHREEGIFLAEGPEFRTGTWIEGARLEDVAPTILHLLGCAVPDDMDGKVLDSALDPRYLADNPVRFSEGEQSDAGDRAERSEEEEAEIRERLQALGYID